MKIKITNDFGRDSYNKGKNESEQIKHQEGEINIEGNCVVRNYDERSYTPSGRGDVTIDSENNQVTLGAKNVLKDNNVDLSAVKYSVFMAVASADGNGKNLTLTDIEKVAGKRDGEGKPNDKFLINLGVTKIAWDKKNGVMTITIGDKGVLRFDFETEEEANKKEVNSVSQRNTGTQAGSVSDTSGSRIKDSAAVNSRQVQNSTPVQPKDNKTIPTYIDVSVNVLNGSKQTIKMEKGCSFENNSAIYRMNDDGVLSVYDKKKGKWLSDVTEIKMTSYQFDALRAVANNTNESRGNIVLSEDDIKAALDLYKNNKLKNDLSEFVNLSVYEVKDVISCSNNSAIGVYVKKNEGTNRNNSATLIFKYGTEEDAIVISDFIHNNLINDEDTGANTNVKPQTGDYYTKKLAVSGLKASAQAGTLIKNAEGRRLKPYKCPSGKWTIGYGHTDGVKWNSPKITKKKAEAYLNADMEVAAKTVRKYVKVDLTQAQFDALVSFVFNVGSGNFKKSTLLEKLNKGHYQAAAKQLSKWVYASGSVQPGLERRRKAERNLFEGKA